MSPEAIKSNSEGYGAMTLKIGPASDVWSLGCILYLMTYGRTPFQKFSILQKLQRIPDPSYNIEFKPLKNKALLNVMELCLQRDAKTRPSIASLLEHEFLHPEVAYMVRLGC